MFVRYTLCFCGARTKNVPFQLPTLLPLFLLVSEEKLHNMVEKIICMEREGEAPPFRLQSADLLCYRKKLKQLYWKQMLTLCRLLKMERVHSVAAVTKGYGWQSGFLWWITFLACGRTADVARNQKGSQPVCHVKVLGTPGTKLGCFLFFFNLSLQNA